MGNANGTTSNPATTEKHSDENLTNTENKACNDPLPDTPSEESTGDTLNDQQYNNNHQQSLDMPPDACKIPETSEETKKNVKLLEDSRTSDAPTANEIKLIPVQFNSSSDPDEDDQEVQDIVLKEYLTRKGQEKWFNFLANTNNFESALTNSDMNGQPNNGNDNKGYSSQDSGNHNLKPYQINRCLLCNVCQMDLNQSVSCEKTNPSLPSSELLAKDVDLRTDTCFNLSPPNEGKRYRHTYTQTHKCVSCLHVCVPSTQKGQSLLI